MHPTLLALLEVLLLAGGSLAARWFVRRVGRGERKLVVMASVSAWLVLFGLVPFSVFAAFVRPGTGQAAGPVSSYGLPQSLPHQKEFTSPCALRQSCTIALRCTLSR